MELESGLHTAWLGEANRLTHFGKLSFLTLWGCSIGFHLFYGFRVNSGEYKVMGLAPYGSLKYV